MKAAETAMDAPRTLNAGLAQHVEDPPWSADYEAPTESGSTTLSSFPCSDQLEFALEGTMAHLSNDQAAILWAWLR